MRWSTWESNLHRKFCYMTAMDMGGAILHHGRVPNDAVRLVEYIQRWGGEVEVAVEACGFWPAFVECVQPHAKRVVLVHPQRVKAIASAKLKNDRVDSNILAHLLRTNLLPEAWKADAATRVLRQATRLRVNLGQQRTQLKNRVHAVLHQQGLRPPVSDLFGKGGRQWLAAVQLSSEGRHAVDAYLSLLDPLEHMIQEEERRLRSWGRDDDRVRWLATIPGIGPYSAAVLLAEIGDIHRFANKRQLYSYAGLVPRVRESAERSRRGSITRGGSPRLRWILTEAVQNAIRASAAARRYFERLARRKPRQVAVVALARKLLGAIYALLQHGVCFSDEAFAAM